MNSDVSLTITVPNKTSLDRDLLARLFSFRQGILELVILTKTHYDQLRALSGMPVCAAKDFSGELDLSIPNGPSRKIRFKPGLFTQFHYNAQI